MSFCKKLSLVLKICASIVRQIFQPLLHTISPLSNNNLTSFKQETVHNEIRIIHKAKNFLTTNKQPLYSSHPTHWPNPLRWRDRMSEDRRSSMRSNKKLRIFLLSFYTSHPITTKVLQACGQIDRSNRRKSFWRNVQRLEIIIKRRTAKREYLNAVRRFLFVQKFYFYPISCVFFDFY